MLAGFRLAKGPNGPTRGNRGGSPNAAQYVVVVWRRSIRADIRGIFVAIGKSWPKSS